MRVQEEDAASGWNVQDQIDSPNSVLSFWRSVLSLRKDPNLRALVYGNFNLLSPQDEKVFAHVRNLEGQNSVLVVLNFSDQDVVFKIHEDDAIESQKELEFKSKGIVKSLKGLGTAKELIGTREGAAKWKDGNKLLLSPFEGWMFRLD